MKVLLDENIPHDMRPLLLGAHEVFTVAWMGWRAIENGDLLRLAANEGFDVLVTTDSKMEYERNSTTLPVAVIVLRARSNSMIDLEPLVPELLRALSNLIPRAIVTIGS